VESLFATAVVVAVGSGDGFAAQGAGGECSNSIARLAQNSSPVANATISLTDVCKSTMRVWTGSLKHPIGWSRTSWSTGEVLGGCSR